MQDEQAKIKQELHLQIYQSDLKKLKESVDKLQRSMVNFDDPSLLLLAIEVYLDPICLVNEEYQREVIIFLIKCGINLWVPGGNILVYIYNWCIMKKVHTEADFEEKITKLCELLILHGQTHILSYRVPTMEYLTNFQNYMTQQWAAFKIQQCWRRMKQRRLDKYTQTIKQRQHTQY